jgi:hypothetical protein
VSNAGSVASFLGAALVVVSIGAIMLVHERNRYQRESFIRQYVFARWLLDALKKSYPALQDKDTFLVARALRCYFLVHLRAGPQRVSMPSKVVDALWHEFILDTQTYQEFCARAFGGFFHHIPAVEMVPGISSHQALRRTWRLACLEENINPNAPTRLPLLFAIDVKLDIPDGNRFELDVTPMEKNVDARAVGRRELGLWRSRRMRWRMWRRLRWFLDASG